MLDTNVYEFLEKSLDFSICEIILEKFHKFQNGQSPFTSVH